MPIIFEKKKKGLIVHFYNHIILVRVVVTNKAKLYCTLWIQNYNINEIIEILW